MHHIFCIIGKSASGKDTLYRLLMEDKDLHLSHVVSSTTRPIRDGELEGREYHFHTIPEYEKAKENGRVIESRCYPSYYGPWYYYTEDDGSIDLAMQSYLIIGTLESFVAFRERFGAEAVIPLYIELEDGERLLRAIHREQEGGHPRYEEMCRRFLADQADFSEEKIRAAGITVRFDNGEGAAACAQKLKEYIEGYGSAG